MIEIVERLREEWKQEDEAFVEEFAAQAIAEALDNFQVEKEGFVEDFMVNQLPCVLNLGQRLFALELE